MAPYCRLAARGQRRYDVEPVLTASRGIEDG